MSASRAHRAPSACVAALPSTGFAREAITRVATETGRAAWTHWRALEQTRRSFWRWTGVALLLGVGAAVFLGWGTTPLKAAIGLAIQLAWTTIWCFMVAVHLRLVRDPATREPRPRLGFPNGLTMLRIVLTPVLGWAIMTYPRLSAQPEIAAAVIFVVGFTDVLDGLIARATGWLTELGGYLDHWADVLICTGVAVAELRAGLLPGWLAAIIIVRYTGAGLGGVYVLSAVEKVRIAPSLSGKLVTGVVGLVLFYVVAQKLLFPDYTRLSLAFFIAAGVVTVANMIEMTILSIKGTRIQST